MSDTCNAALSVTDCPEDQRAALLAAVEELDMGSEAYDSPEDTTAPLLSWGWNDAQLDLNETIAAALIEAAPGATFTTYAEPAYEYPGCVTMYAPDLGRFDGVCDADGVPYVTATELRKVTDLDSMRRLAGLPWFERIYAREAGSEATAVEPDTTASAPPEPRYTRQDLDTGNLADLGHDLAANLRAEYERSTCSHPLYGIVDEDAGGIIAYAIGEDNAAELARALEASR